MSHEHILLYCKHLKLVYMFTSVAWPILC